MSLLHHWKLDDNAASTTVVAIVGTNATLGGGDNTSVKHLGSGPGTGITSSFDMNGSDDTIDISAASISFASGVECSFSAWFQLDSNTNQYLAGRDGSSNDRILLTTDTNVLVRFGGTTQNFTLPSLGTTNWHHILITRTTGNSVRVFLDGTESVTGALALAATWAPVALAHGSTLYLNGRMAWVKFFDSDESANVATLYAEKDAAGGAVIPVFMNQYRQRGN